MIGIARGEIRRWSWFRELAIGSLGNPAAQREDYVRASLRERSRFANPIPKQFGE